MSFLANFLYRSIMNDNDSFSMRIGVSIFWGL